MGCVCVWSLAPSRPSACAWSSLPAHPCHASYKGSEDEQPPRQDRLQEQEELCTSRGWCCSPSPHSHTGSDPLHFRLVSEVHTTACLLGESILPSCMPGWGEGDTLPRTLDVHLSLTG